MSIHDDAIAAFQSVYDKAILSLDIQIGVLHSELEVAETSLAETIIERDRALTDISEYKVQVNECTNTSTRLMTERDAARKEVETLSSIVAEMSVLIETLKTRVKELESQVPEEPKRSVGALPLGTAPATTTDRPISVLPGSLEASLSNASPSSVLVLRGGNHYLNTLSIKKPITIEGAKGEQAWIDGEHRAQVSLVVAADGVTLRGFGIRNYDVLADKNFGGGADAWNRGLIVTRPNALLEELHFQDNGQTALSATTVREFHAHALSVISSNATVRHCTFKNTGGTHIHANNASGFVLEDSLLVGANRLRMKMQPVTAAFKATSTTGAVVRRNRIEDVPLASGVWFDMDCAELLVYQNYIEAGYEQIEIEASNGAIIAFNTVKGDGTGSYNIRSLISRNVRIWNNDVTGTGSEHVFIGALMDNRTSYPASGNEIVNNILRGDFRYAQVGAYDNAGVRTGAQIVSRVSGNTFIPHSSGKNEIIHWASAPGIKGNRTLDQMIVSNPEIFSRGLVPLPPEIEALRG